MIVKLMTNFEAKISGCADMDENATTRKSNLEIVRSTSMQKFLLIMNIVIKKITS